MTTRKIYSRKKPPSKKRCSKIAKRPDQFKIRLLRPLLSSSKIIIYKNKRVFKHQKLKIRPQSNNADISRLRFKRRKISISNRSAMNFRPDSNFQTMPSLHCKLSRTSDGPALPSPRCRQAPANDICSVRCKSSWRNKLRKRRSVNGRNDRRRKSKTAKEKRRPRSTLPASSKNSSGSGKLMSTDSRRTQMLSSITKHLRRSRHLICSRTL